MKWSVIHWYLQRISGAALVLLLIAHFWVEHFASETLLRGGLSYEAIRGRIQQPVWQAIDLTFLAVALYHGLSGLRNILLDYSGIGRVASRAITVFLILVGGVWMYWGVEAFRNL